MPTLTFLGATGTVTGSKYLLETGGERLMIDCGLFQGLKELRLRNWNPLPIPPSTINWLVLTHAHLDHVGYIPRLVKDGYRGEILATPATVDLAKITLPDSGHLQEEDAAYANKIKSSKHSPALPLYTLDEAVKSLESFRAIDDLKPLELSSHFTLRFFGAGHILGARSIEVTIRENGKTLKVLFSGDLGRYSQLIIREPAVPDAADYLLCESTYGDRLHPTDDYQARLAKIVETTAQRGGAVVIPAFAIGRTQELLYIFRRLIEKGQMRSIPIHVDSPMAIHVTDVYLRHREDDNLETAALESHGGQPFSPPNVHFDRTVEESKALNNAQGPRIIISASGMATGGRVLHHLAQRLPDPRNTVLFVGYQGAGTRGQKIQSGAKFIKIFGVDISVHAQIEDIGNLSGHADYGEILKWLGRISRPPQQTFITHGEPGPAESLKEKIIQKLHWNARVPAYLEKVSL